MNSPNGLLAIRSNTDGRLVAQQQPPGHGALYLLIPLLLLVSILLVRVHAYKFLVIPAFLLLLVLLPSGQRNTLQVEVDQRSRRIILSEMEKQTILSSSTLDAVDLASAEMQSNRGARRIVLIARDGHQIFPLGEEELQGADDQYVILNALRQVIGQTPVNSNQEPSR